MKDDLTFNEFKKLMDEWHKAVMFHSMYGQMVKHENYAKILSYDKDLIIRYACLMLVDDYIHLVFILLGQCVDKEKMPPFDKYYAGRVPVMKECWRYWALKEKIVESKYNPELYWVEDKDGNIGDWH